MAKSQTQNELDREMARAIRYPPTRRDKTLIQKLAQLFTLVKQEKRRRGQ